MILEQRFFSGCGKRMKYFNYQISICSPKYEVKVELL